MSSTLAVWSRVLTCQHCRPNGGAELLEKLLPSGYTHLLCVNEPSDVKEDYFRVHLKVKLSTEEEVDKWLQDLQYSSAWTWRIARTYPQSGRYNAYRVDLRCQYKTYSSGKLSRNTNCPATIFLVLKRHMEDRRSRSTDPHTADGFFLHVNWRNQHNHPLASENTCQKDNEPAATIIKLTGLYENGHSPVTAIDTLKYDLQEEQVYYVINDSSGIGDAHQVVEEEVSADATGAADQSIPEDSPEFLEGQLDDIIGLVKSKLRDDPAFTAPLRSFVSNFHNLKTDGALKSALVCFGTTTRTSSKVRVHPAPRALRGRKASRAGRPPKGSRREHPYTKQGRAMSSPHNLSFFVQEKETNSDQ
ncbi:uncharacterized protein si:dkey-75a21.2 [Brachionichthys hirsutus]|uniref:uncharacterized protein si:dkey-75a21.2 n=1 Tax=Brachionichthys hirsutus TaxID=412623 RepID=UPI003604FFE8